MKPEQFIREFGVEKAREVVETAPDKTATHHVADTDTYYSEDFLTYFDHSLEDWETADLNNISELETIYEHVVNLSDLKRLVESLDLIKAYGGIESCRQSLYMLHELTENPEPIREAVRDYESIYGGGENA